MIQPVHLRVPGRARFRILPLRGSPDLGRALVTALEACGRFSHVAADARTGTLLLRFDARMTHEGAARLLGHALRAAGGGAGGPTAESLRPDAPAAVPAAVPAAGHEPALPPEAPAGAAEGPAWHALDAGRVLQDMESSARAGLTAAEAARRLARTGPNALPKPPPRSLSTMLAGQVVSLPNGLLAAAAGVSVVTGGLAEAVVILGVIGVNAVIGLATELRAEKTIASLNAAGDGVVPVLRDGLTRSVPAQEVVPGDVLLLKPGNPVAADGRVLESAMLSIDESLLTGESLPAAKVAEALAAGGAPLAERRNMAYMGTVVTGGRGSAVAVATGLRTEMGRLRAMLGEAERPRAPIEQRLEGLGNQLVMVFAGVCAGVFCVGLLRGLGPLAMLRTSVSLAAAAIPEGLPAAATTTFALGIMRMRRHGAVVRRLTAVETLGAVQTVCVDKTGTVTVNRMSAARVDAGGRTLAVAADRLVDGQELNDAQAADLRLLLAAATLCNETQVSIDGHGGRALDGSPTEAALVRLALGCGVDAEALRASHPRVSVQDRSEQRLYMVTVHERPDGGRRTAVKGSPMEVLGLCARVRRDGRDHPLTAEERAQAAARNEAMAGDGLRVLGVAHANGPDEAASGDGLTWLGLIGLEDPVRDGVPELLAAFRRAGIETVMITGDQSATAYAVARRIRLAGGEPLRILDSSELRNLDPTMLAALADKTHVFSRVSPANKLEIVRAIQAKGKVVAMTGDGVNDSPALKAADVGIAMGQGGTDAARGVADIILERDDLAGLAQAIGDGRTIGANIKKAVRFFLATNFSEIVLTFGGLALGLGAACSPMQLLWINLISDIFPGLALALEPAEPDVLDRPPRDPAAPLFSGAEFRTMGREAGVIAAGALAAMLWARRRHGPGPAAGTLAFQSLVLGQLLHAVACRSEATSIFRPAGRARNRALDAALGGSLALQALTAWWPPLYGLLGCTPLGPADALAALGTAAATLAVNEGLKAANQG